MFTLIFLLAYLLPALPVARRVAWVIGQTRAGGRVIPARQAARNDRGWRSTIVYGGRSNYESEVCHNCGGDRNYHPDGDFKGLGRQSSSSHSSCRNFVQWDGERMEWPEQRIMRNWLNIPLALVLGLFYPAILGIEATKFVYSRIDPDWNGFAKPYHGVESRRDRVERLLRESERAREELEATIARQEAELGLGREVA